MLVADVRAGLTGSPKVLAPKYFYDARGSELFDQITSVEDYYPTRCERALLNRHAPEITAGFEELVELGSGMADKTHALLFAMAGTGELRRYVPFDVDPSVVERCAADLEEKYPGLEVHGVVGDFERELSLIPPDEKRLFAFLGGTLGNLDPGMRTRFLAALREVVGPTDALLVGIDLEKDPATLERAYDDSEGVTAEFNRNVLVVLNRELDADFDPAAFEHVAVWVEEDKRVEMRLRASSKQHVRLPGADIEVDFDEGEEMRTEISCKFTREGIEEELRTAGFTPRAFFTDGLFALALAA
ncbi:MAG: L-histidine N(alpha)-methyltransferase [Thermoleophilaceae bacterium]|nr:L-histidine N(alpha)-methyltransferase [Thermoleophilaceae bacterium]